MKRPIRDATPDECARLWPAIRAERLMASLDELLVYRDAGPWRVRVTHRGEAALLGRWREHLDVLAIRSVWASSEKRVGEFADDARELARVHGFSRVLSPLLPEPLLRPYWQSEFATLQTVVAIQGRLEAIAHADLPPGIAIREGGAADLDALAGIDARCFEDFWRYGAGDLVTPLGCERAAVAMTEDCHVIGYTLATVGGSSAMLSRMCVAPEARRRGVGAALLAEVARWATREGALTLALCTQESNLAARALYARCGLSEIAERYAVLLADAVGRGSP